MTEKKLNLKKMLSLSLSAVLVVLLALYIWQNRHDMAQLLQLDAGTVALMFLFGLGGCVMNCVYHRIILSTFKVQLDGEVKLEAVCGDCRDSATIRRVDRPNPAYKLGKNSGNGGNWT